MRDAWVRVRPVLSAVLEGVVLPVGVYLVLTATGASDVVALTGSAAASVVLLGIGWLRTRILNTLGVLVLVRFVLSLVLLGITGDARLLLVKDAAITFLTGLAILASALLRESFILRIQRDLAQDRNTFDGRVASDASVRRLYSRCTIMWGIGLVVEPMLEIVIIYGVTLPIAVLLCNTVGTVVILGLIIITQWALSRSTIRPVPVGAAGPGASTVPTGPGRRGRSQSTRSRESAP
ncbi:MAG: VC0807 family protein [Arachnia sp.]